MDGPKSRASRIVLETSLNSRNTISFSTWTVNADTRGKPNDNPTSSSSSSSSSSFTKQGSILLMRFPNTFELSVTSRKHELSTSQHINHIRIIHPSCSSLLHRNTNHRRIYRSRTSCLPNDTETRDLEVWTLSASRYIRSASAFMFRLSWISPIAVKTSPRLEDGTCVRSVGVWMNSVGGWMLLFVISSHSNTITLKHCVRSSVQPWRARAPRNSGPPTWVLEIVPAVPTRHHHETFARATPQLGQVCSRDEEDVWISSWWAPKYLYYSMHSRDNAQFKWYGLAIERDYDEFLELYAQTFQLGSWSCSYATYINTMMWNIFSWLESIVFDDDYSDTRLD